MASEKTLNLTTLHHKIFSHRPTSFTWLPRQPLPESPALPPYSAWLSLQKVIVLVCSGSPNKVQLSKQWEQQDFFLMFWKSKIKGQDWLHGFLTPPFGCTCVCLCPNIFLNQRFIESESTCRVSLYANYFFKGPVSKKKKDTFQSTGIDAWCVNLRLWWLIFTVILI